MPFLCAIASHAKQASLQYHRLPMQLHDAHVQATLSAATVSAASALVVGLHLVLLLLLLLRGLCWHTPHLQAG
jgi:hypothetical protein